jgi:hypothetical protein
MSDSLLEEFKKERKPIEEQSNINMMVAGATPLLIGLLSGKSGPAMKVASEGIMEQQKMQFDRERSLLDFLKSREKSKSSGDTKLYKSIGADGKTRYVTRDEAIGGIAPEGRRSLEEAQKLEEMRLSGKKTYKDYATVKDIEKAEKTGSNMQKVDIPETGELAQINKGTGAVRVIKTGLEGELPPEQKKRVIKSADEYLKSSEKSIAATDKLEKALTGIDRGGNLGTKLGLMTLIKEIETRMSDADRNYYSEPIGRFNQLLELMRQEKTGKLRPEIVAEAKTMLGLALGKSRAYGREGRQRRIDMLMADKRIKKDDIEKYFGKEPAVFKESIQEPMSSSGMHDEAAINWAKSNPNDPRSAEILRLNGVK